MAEWKAFTPKELRTECCQARTWSNGEGGQCSLPIHFNALCANHNKQFEEKRELVHGFVTGPIPEKKLREFQMHALKTTSPKRPPKQKRDAGESHRSDAAQRKRMKYLNRKKPHSATSRKSFLDKLQEPQAGAGQGGASSSRRGSSGGREMAQKAQHSEDDSSSEISGSDDSSTSTSTEQPVDSKATAVNAQRPAATAAPRKTPPKPPPWVEPPGTPVFVQQYAAASPPSPPRPLVEEAEEVPSPSPPRARPATPPLFRDFRVEAHAALETGPAKAAPGHPDLLGQLATAKLGQKGPVRPRAREDAFRSREDEVRRTVCKLYELAATLEEEPG